MSSHPFILRWGIVGTGWISEGFTKDLVLDIKNRPSPLHDGSNISHAITAVGARNLERTQAFIDKNFPKGAAAQVAGLCDEPVKAFASWEEVIVQENVDAVYIGTPHTSHYEQAFAALSAGKHVLVEKPATLNAAEWKSLVNLATEKQLFLMEAVWTRFFPLTFKMQDLLFKDKVIGDVHHVQVDFAMDFLNIIDKEHRLLNPKLAGGVLLDLGPYPMMWSLLTLYHNPDNQLSPPVNVHGSMLRHPETGVDVFTSFNLDFPKLMARANCQVNICSTSPADACIRITGTTGQMIMPMGPSRPEAIKIRRYTEDESPIKIKFEEKRIDFAIDGMGLHWQADEVARCIRDGKLEAKRMPHNETTMVMELFDQIRKEAGYELLPGLEKL